MFHFDKAPDLEYQLTVFLNQRRKNNTRSDIMPGQLGFNRPKAKKVSEEDQDDNSSNP